MSQEFVEEYASSLKDLTFNSKPHITMLTMLAEENVQHAPQIVKVIEAHLQKINPNAKLPTLYLIDSIMKNVGQVYQSLFTQNIVSNFCAVFEKVDEKVRGQMYKLRQTWSDIFPNKKLYAIDVRVKEMDPAWPILAQPPQQIGIHINPRFLKPPVEENILPKKNQEVEEEEMRKQLLAKQQELLKIQRKKLELDLLQAQVMVEEQKRQLILREQQLRVQQGPSGDVQKALTLQQLQNALVSALDPQKAKQAKAIPIAAAQGVSASQLPAIPSATAAPKTLPNNSLPTPISNNKPVDLNAVTKKIIPSVVVAKPEPPANPVAPAPNPAPAVVAPKPGLGALAGLPSFKKVSPLKAGAKDPDKGTPPRTSPSPKKSADKSPKKKDGKKTPSPKKKPKHENKNEPEHRAKKDPKEPKSSKALSGDKDLRSRSKSTSISPSKSKLTSPVRGQGRKTERRDRRSRSRSPGRGDKGRERDERPAKRGRRSPRREKENEGKFVENRMSPTVVKDVDLRTPPSGSFKRESREDLTEPLGLGLKAGGEPPFKKSKTGDAELDEIFGDKDQDYRQLDQPVPKLSPIREHQGWAQYKASRPDEFKNPLRARDTADNREAFGFGKQDHDWRTSPGGLKSGFQPWQNRDPRMTGSGRDPRMHRLDPRARNFAGSRPPPSHFYQATQESDPAIPRALMFDRGEKIMRQADAQLRAGMLTMDQHREIMEQLAKLYELQRMRLVQREQRMNETYKMRRPVPDDVDVITISPDSSPRREEPGGSTRPGEARDMDIRELQPREEPRGFGRPGEARDTDIRERAHHMPPREDRPGEAQDVDIRERGHPLPPRGDPRGGVRPGEAQDIDIRERGHPVPPRGDPRGGVRPGEAQDIDIRERGHPVPPRRDLRGGVRPGEAEDIDIRERGHPVPPRGDPRGGVRPGEAQDTDIREREHPMPPKEESRGVVKPGEAQDIDIRERMHPVPAGEEPRGAVRPGEAQDMDIRERAHPVQAREEPQGVVQPGEPQDTDIRERVHPVPPMSMEGIIEDTDIRDKSGRQDETKVAGENQSGERPGEDKGDVQATQAPLPAEDSVKNAKLPDEALPLPMAKGDDNDARNAPVDEKLARMVPGDGRRETPPPLLVPKGDEEASDDPRRPKSIKFKIKTMDSLAKEKDMKLLDLQPMLDPTKPRPGLPPPALAPPPKTSPIHTVMIDDKPREVRFFGDVGIVLLENNDPREIAFRGPPQEVVVGKQIFRLSFLDRRREFMIDGYCCNMRFGAPTREIVIDEVPYSAIFGGPPFPALINGKKYDVRLCGPTPEVYFGDKPRFDLLPEIMEAKRLEEEALAPRPPVPARDQEPPDRPGSGWVTSTIGRDYDPREWKHSNRDSPPVPFQRPPGRDEWRPSRFSDEPPFRHERDRHYRDDRRPRGEFREFEMWNRRGEPVRDDFRPGGRGPLPPALRGERGPSGLRGSPDEFYEREARNSPYRDSPPRQAPYFPENRFPHGPPPQQQGMPPMNPANRFDGPHNSGGMMNIPPRGPPPGMPPRFGGPYGYPPPNSQRPPMSGFPRNNFGFPPNSQNMMSQVPGVPQRFQPPPIPVLPPQLNVSELFEKLVAKGIIPNVSTNPESKDVDDNSNDAPSSEEPKLPPAEKLPLVELNSESLKTKHPTVISHLYCGIQCSSCGIRFTAEQTDKYAQHLDWHFRQNRREKDSARKALSRKWYFDVQDWVQFEEIEDLEERARSFFEIQATEEQTEAGDDVPPSVPAGENEEDKNCVVCHERFELYWDEDHEEWHFRDAVRHDEKNYHPLCFEDFKEQQLKEAAMEESAAEEPQKDGAAAVKPEADDVKDVTNPPTDKAVSGIEQQLKVATVKEEIKEEPEEPMDTDGAEKININEVKTEEPMDVQETLEVFNVLSSRYTVPPGIGLDIEDAPPEEKSSEEVPPDEVAPPSEVAPPEGGKTSEVAPTGDEKLSEAAPSEEKPEILEADAESADDAPTVEPMDTTDGLEKSQPVETPANSEEPEAKDPEKICSEEPENLTGSDVQVELPSSETGESEVSTKLTEDVQMQDSAEPVQMQDSAEPVAGESDVPTEIPQQKSEPVEHEGSMDVAEVSTLEVPEVQEGSGDADVPAESGGDAPAESPEASLPIMEVLDSEADPEREVTTDAETKTDADLETTTDQEMTSATCLVLQDTSQLKPDPDPALETTAIPETTTDTAPEILADPKDDAPASSTDPDVPTDSVPAAPDLDAQSKTLDSIKPIVEPSVEVCAEGGAATPPPDVIDEGESIKLEPIEHDESELLHVGQGANTPVRKEAAEGDESLIESSPPDPPVYKIQNISRIPVLVSSGGFPAVQREPDEDVSLKESSDIVSEFAFEHPVSPRPPPREEAAQEPQTDGRFQILPPVNRGTELSGLCSIM